MARRSVYTEAGRRRLHRRPRRSVRPRGKSRIPDSVERTPLYTDEYGTTLNQWESVVAWALIDLRIPFESQKQLGPVRQIGGALVDFLIPYPWMAALEIQGPFHDTTEGQARDFMRRFNREYYGYAFKEVTYADLFDIHRVLLQLLGRPLLGETAS